MRTAILNPKMKHDREKERERHGRPWHINIFLPFQNLTPICKPPSNESRRDRQASIHFQISMMQMQNGVNIIPSQQLTKMPNSVERGLSDLRHHRRRYQWLQRCTLDASLGMAGL